MFKYWMSVSGVKSRYDLLDVLLSLSVSHMDVYFPVSTKSPLPPVHLCLRLCLSINVCLCTFVFLCVFSPLSSLLCRSLCPCLAVSTFGENFPGAPLGKFLPLSSTLSSPTGSNWLLTLSFFLVVIIPAHSRWVVLFLINTNKNLRRS